MDEEKATPRKSKRKTSLTRREGSVRLTEKGGITFRFKDKEMTDC